MKEFPMQWLKERCNRYMNGQCATVRCLRRGGVERGTVPVDLNLATCEAHEAAATYAETFKVAREAMERAEAVLERLAMRTKKDNPNESRHAGLVATQLRTALDLLK